MHEIDPEKEEFEIFQLKDNMLPRGIVPLEDIFYFNDVAKNPKIELVGADVEECNIGSEQNPKMIKLSNSFPTVRKQEYIDVFAWSYEEMKAYDTSIIQHKIPIKEYQKPFKQKLRRINPVLMPLVEK